MTVLEALPRDSDGFIVVPIGGINQYGEYVPGTTTEAFMYMLFGTQVDQALPLTEEQFATLRDTRTGLWQLNWDQYRADGVVTVV